MKTVAQTLRELPGGGSSLGKRQYIYVAQLANGVVKVGRTLTPKDRMASLSMNGHRPVRLEVFDSPNSPISFSESALIQAMKRCGNLVGRKREYFSHVSFEAACHFARQISQRKVTLLLLYPFENKMGTCPKFIKARLKNIAYAKTAMEPKR